MFEKLMWKVCIYADKAATKDFEKRNFYRNFKFLSKLFWKFATLKLQK